MSASLLAQPPMQRLWDVACRLRVGSGIYTSWEWSGRQDELQQAFSLSGVDLDGIRDDRATSSKGSPIGSSQLLLLPLFDWQRDASVGAAIETQTRIPLTAGLTDAEIADGEQHEGAKPNDASGHLTASPGFRGPGIFVPWQDADPPHDWRPRVRCPGSSLLPGLAVLAARICM
jgi:hypothetical protein